MDYKDSICRLHIYIEGLVQGVGFRQSFQTQARKRRLSGWVRNLADGRVEAQIEGPRCELKSVLEWCDRGPALAQVVRVIPNWAECTPESDSFSIRF